MEIALASNYRIAEEKTKLGLPEVHLGLLPGAGGTQRLPRLAGISAALQIMTSGKSISASEALKLGVVDKISTNLLEDAKAFAKQVAEKNSHPKTSMLTEKFDNDELNKVKEFIHFACTSEDINNISHALILKDSLNKVLIPEIKLLIDQMSVLAKRYSGRSILSRTHGQPASPSTIGKEFSNVIYRMKKQLKNDHANRREKGI